MAVSVYKMGYLLSLAVTQKTTDYQYQTEESAIG